MADDLYTIARQRIERARRDLASTLDLRGLSLTALPRDVWLLTRLHSLDLSSNQLTTLPPEIGNLTALRSLELNNNRISSIPPNIGDLRSLERLELSSNALTKLPSEIGKLTGLQTLLLAHNQLTLIPDDVGKLSALRRLALGNNKITTFPPLIGSLTSLHNLQLIGNYLTSLPPDIGLLAALDTLDIQSNKLTSLPREIGMLTKLRVLWLNNNELHELPTELSLCRRLTHFSAWNNKLTSVPTNIFASSALESLQINTNRFTTLPPDIAAIKTLKILDLGNNQISSLPKEIGSLPALTTLRLGSNRLTSLPTEIGDLSALEVLDLHNNRLVTLPEELNKLSVLGKLFLHGNDELGIPLEVLGFESMGDMEGRTSDPTAKATEILAYYFNTRQGAKSLREVKLILVGRGEVGKTTFADALQGKPFKKNRARTDGISITRWSLKPEGGAAVVRIWDFGGQQIMHGTHQFFLTRRAVYVIMIDGRDDRFQREAEYWLKHVRAFGGDSTVMVVMNRQAAYKFDLDRNALASKYGVSPDLFFPTECSRRQSIAAPRRAISQVVSALLSKQANFPTKWWPIKAHLEGMKADYLSDSAFRTLCAQNGVEAAQEQDQLLDRLNELGIIVHFADDNLSDLKVLDPEWATDGVYRVVTNEKLREEKHGKLRASSLKEMLPTKRWPEASHRRYILDLMLRFDLCFPAEGENDVFIVPDLLPEKTPDLSEWDPTSCVVFRYNYPILPHGILPRFISKTHTLSEGRGRERWRSGVVIGKDGAEAMVRADYDSNIVDIWVRGAHRDARRALLTIVRGKFDEIHGRFRDLNPEELVAVPKHPTVFVSYRDMILDERRGKSTVAVTIQGERVDAQIDTILSGVESAEERRKAAEQSGEVRAGNRNVVCDTYIEGDSHMRDVNMKDNYGQIAETMENCSNMVQRLSPGKNKELLEALRRDVEDLIKRLPDSKKGEAPQIAENLEAAIKQATKDKPDRKWYSVSAEGLLDAAGWVQDFSGKIGGTLKNLGTSLWPDFSLPKIDK